MQRLGAFDARLVRVAVGPIGNASDARGQTLVWEPRSQQAPSVLYGSRWLPMFDPCA